MNPFIYVNAINSTKENLMEGSENDELAEKQYDSFIVNRALSYFPDTLLYSNEMNKNWELPKKAQFLFLLNTIRPKKRYTKWNKKKYSEDVIMISEHLNCSRSKAEDYVKVLTASELNRLRKIYEKE